jgi:uncharacterized protein YerC
MQGFKDIPGCEGLYQVNGVGEVLSLPRKYFGKGGCIRYTKSVILKSRLNTTGYLRVTLYDQFHRCHSPFVHRLVAITFIPNIHNKPFVNHINSQRIDNRVENLEWCSNSENQLHAFKYGYQQKGELRPLAKLNEAQVLSIKRLLAKGLTMRSIAERHGVSATVINQIKKGTSWSWV